MNQIGFAKRKNSNKVLFHFDSLVDLHLAVVYALQKDYPSGGSMQSINYSFLHQSKIELKKHRIFDIGKDIIQECFLGPMRDKWQSTYKIYMEEEFDRVISDAPITPMLRLIAAFSRVGRGSHVSSSIFCENYNQARIARAMLKTIPADIIVGQPEKIDLNQYARVILGDIRDIDIFTSPKYTHITVLNYGCNLQLVNGVPQLLQDYVKKWDPTNQFEIIDSYIPGLKSNEKR